MPLRPNICLRLLAAVVLVFYSTLGQAQGDVSTRAADRLPETIASFRATSPASTQPAEGLLKRALSDPALVIDRASRAYRNTAGEAIVIELLATEKDAAAYALLTELAAPEALELGKVGLASLKTTNGVLFYQGRHLARLEWTGGAPNDAEVLNVARMFAEQLPAGDEEVPVLTKHLPVSSSPLRPAYAVSLKQLQSFVRGQPILEAISFEGGTEAVAANYGQSQLVIVEFTTPQMSVDNDSRIWTKIAELKNQGAPAPTAYRRVGNYSVFVFNEPDEKSAHALVDQVRYEQVVQWLGDDPHIYERLQRYFTQTSAGVLIAVLKSSGLSLLLCLAAGGLIGTMLFRHRRAQKAALYSDAGGSIRLNLDDLTGPANTDRLLQSEARGERNTSDV